MYGNAPQPVNPLATAGQFVGLQNAMQQNQNAQAQNPLIKANAVSAQQQNQMQAGIIRANQLFENNLNPDGTINFNRLRTAVAKDPIAQQGIDYINKMAAVQNAPQQLTNPNGSTRTVALQSANTILNPTSAQSPAPQNMQQPTPPNAPSQDDIDNAHNHIDTLQNAITPLMNNANPTHSDVIGQAGNVVNAHGVSGGKIGISGGDMTNLLATMPEDQTQLPAWIQQHAQQLQQAKQQLTQNYGPPSSQQQSTPDTTTDNNTTTPSITGPAPGMVEMQQNRALGAQKDIQTARDKATAAQPTIGILNKIIDLSKAGGATGPASSKIAGVYSYLSDLGLAPPGITDAAIQTKEIAKYTGMLIQANGNPGSDARQEGLQAANVNVEQIPQLIQSLARSQLAMQQIHNSRLNVLQNNPQALNDPATEEKLMSQFNQAADPRAQELTLMSPKEQQDYFTTLRKTNPNEVDKVINSFRTMRQLGAFKGQSNNGN